MSVVDYVMGLGAEYSVNPIIFGILYTAATIVFVFCVYWLVRNYKEKRELYVPITACILSYSITYIYVLLEGRNLGWGAYIFIGAAVISTVYTTFRKVKEHDT